MEVRECFNTYYRSEQKVIKMKSPNKPSLEQIIPAVGSSFLVRRFSSSRENALANWHFHPELELIFVNGGSGKRHIGKNVSYFNDGDLVLMGGQFTALRLFRSLDGKPVRNSCSIQRRLFRAGFFQYTRDE